MFKGRYTMETNDNGRNIGKQTSRHSEYDDDDDDRYVSRQDQRNRENGNREERTDYRGNAPSPFGYNGNKRRKDENDDNIKMPRSIGMITTSDRCDKTL